MFIMLIIMMIHMMMSYDDDDDDDYYDDDYCDVDLSLSLFSLSHCLFVSFVVCLNIGLFICLFTWWRDPLTVDMDFDAPSRGTKIHRVPPPVPHIPDRVRGIVIVELFNC